MKFQAEFLGGWILFQLRATMVSSVGSNFRNRKYIVLHLNPYTVVVAIGGKILLPQCDQ